MARKRAVKRVGTPVRRTAQARAIEQVEAMFDASSKVLKRALLDKRTVAELDDDGQIKFDEDGEMVTSEVGGDVKVALYMMDRAWPRRGAMMPYRILRPDGEMVDISTMDGVIECAGIATQHVLNREMTLQDANDLMSYLLRYCHLKAFERIDELRLLVETFEEQSNTGLTKLDPAMVPNWGQFKKETTRATMSKNAVATKAAEKAVRLAKEMGGGE